MACVALCAVFATTARAADYTWSGTSALWNTSNWITSTGTTTFPGGSSGTNTAFINSGTVTFAGNDTFGQATTTSSPVIKIGTGATLSSTNNFTTIWNLNLSGGTLLANGGANGTYPAFQLAGTLLVDGNAASTIAVGAGSNNAINIGGNGNSTLTVNVADVTSSTAADLSVATVLQNSQSGAALTKTGAGTLVLSASNTYTGATTISAGVLALSGAGALASTGTVAITGSGASFDISGATGTRTIGMLTGSAGSTVALGANSLTVGDATSGTFAGSIGGTGGLTKQGAGTLALSGSSGFSGGVTLAAGQLNLNNANALGTGTFTISSGTVDNTSGSAVTLAANNPQAWNGDFTFAGSSGLNLGTGAVTLGASRIVTVTSNTLTIGGPIGGAFGLTKQGAGTLTLTASNSYSGGTTVNAGTLALSGAGRLSGSGNITVGGGTLDLGGASQTTTGVVTLSNGSTLRSGTLTSNNATQAGNNQYTGSITLGTGGAFVTNQRLLLANGGSGSLTIAAGSTGSITFGGDNGSNMNYVGVGGGTAILTINGGTVNFTNASGTNGYLNVGSNSDTSNGSIVVNGGSLNVGTWLKLGGNFSSSAASNARSSLSVTSGTVVVGGGNDASFNGVLFMNGGAGDTASTKTTGTSTLTLGTGGALAVTQIQTGNYGTDTITFDGGTLRARAGSTSFLAASAPLTVNVNAGGATIDTQGFAITIGAALGNGGGGGGLTVSGSGGGLTLTNASSYTGATTINANASLSIGDGTTDGSIAASSNVVNNGSLTINRVSGSTSLNAITGSGSVTKSGAGGLTLNQASTIGSGLTLNAGTLDLGGATSSVAGTLNITGGTLRNGTLNLTGAAGTNDVFANVGSTTTVSANLSSSTVGLSKYGSGTLVLTGTSTFTNANQAANIFVNNGTLQIGPGGALSSASRLLIQGGALQIDAGAGVVGFGGDGAAAGNFVGVDGAGGTLSMAGGTLNFTTANASGAGYLRIGANGSSGSPNSSTMTVSGGTVNVGHSASIGARFDNGNAAVFNNGTLTISGGAFNVGTGSDTATAFGINGALYLKNNAAGTSGTAALNLNGGTLSLKQLIAGSQGTSIVNFNGGTLQARAVSANFLDAAAGLTVNVLDGGATIDTQGFGITIGAALGNGGAGGLTKSGSGTLTLTATNTFSGATSIAAGILSINGTSALAGTSGLTIAGGAGLTYTGGAATFTKPVTVTAGSGTGTIRNSGGGLLTLSGTLSKDNSVLRLTGGAFNVTGVITGATPGKSDLFVDDAFVTLSNTNTYDGPTYVFNSGTLALGVNNAIPNTSSVTLGDATTRGTLVLGSFTDSISQLVFSGAGGTVSLSGDKTAAAQLATAGSLTLGSNANLVLTGAGTTDGLYRLISATSISGSFANANVTGVPSNYKLLYSATGIDLQRNADQSTTFTMTTGTVTRALVNSTVALSGSITNASPAGSANLAVSLSSGGVLNVTGLTSGTSSVAPQTSTSVAGTLNAGATAGSRSWSVINTDSGAITTTSTASGSIDVVNQRTFAVSNSGTINLGNFLRTTAVTGSATVSSVGLNATTANATLGAFSGTNTNGFSLATLDSTVFNGNSLNQSALYTLSGSAASAGAINGSFTSPVTAELGSIDPVAVALVGTAFDPATALLASGGSAVGNAWTISLGEFNQGAGTSSPFGFSISNLLQTAGYTADLDLASFSLASDSGAIFTTLSGTSFPTLAAGDTNPFSAWMSLTNAGTFTNIYNLSFNSSKNGTSLGGTPQNVTLTVTGVIIVPEPGAIALAGIGIAVAAWAARRRK